MKVKEQDTIITEVKRQKFYPLRKARSKANVEYRTRNFE